MKMVCLELQVTVVREWDSCKKKKRQSIKSMLLISNIVSFRYTVIYEYIYIYLLFQIIFPYRLLSNTINQLYINKLFLKKGMLLSWLT